MATSIAALQAKRTAVTKRRIKAAGAAAKPATTKQEKAAKRKAQTALHQLVTEQHTLTHRIEHLQQFEADAKRNATPADKRRRAKPPGKRVSRTGKVYYESRTNRADASRASRI